MKASRLKPDDDAWRQTLEVLPHDVHHLPEYVKLEAERLDGEPIALLIEDAKTMLLVPLIQLKDNVEPPYGYVHPPNVAAEVMAALKEELDLPELTLPEQPPHPWPDLDTRDNRRTIGRLKRKGTAYVDHEWEHFGSFMLLYDQTEAMTLSTSYFTKLRETLGEHLSLCVVDFDGDIVSAGLFTAYQEQVRLHLAGKGEADLLMFDCVAGNED